MSEQSCSHISGEVVSNAKSWIVLGLEIGGVDGAAIWLKMLSSRRCDRRNDCGDYSDERGCSYPPCHDNQFTCQNGRCISKFFVCDEDNDCGDGSDEQEHLCHTPEPTCPPHQFRCDNGNCIDLGKVCNHLDDCSDNSDEKGCGESRAGDGTVYILHPFGLLRTFQYVFYVENLQTTYCGFYTWYTA